jgi:hypothetical protein
MATGQPAFVSVEMVYLGVGYVALGFSEDGKMDPKSQAIVGLSADNVKKYNLLSKADSGIQLSPRQTVANVWFEQTANQTLMRFTKLLTEEEEVEIKFGGMTNVIWAVGSSNTLGYHASRGSIPVIFDKCVDLTGEASLSSTTIAPTLVATVAPVSAGPISQAPTIVPSVSVTVSLVTASPVTASPVTASTVTASTVTASTVTAQEPLSTLSPVIIAGTTAPAVGTASPVVSSSAPASVATSAPAQSPTLGAGAVDVDCSKYQHTVKLNDLVSFSYVVRIDDTSSSEGTLTVEVVYNGLGYIAMGFSEDGMMDPKSQAVVGEGPGKVTKYNLLSKSRSGIRNAALQTLTNTSFEQTATQTTMSFTKILVEQDEVPVSVIGPTNVIWAVGGSNELGYHAARGTLPMTFETCVGSPSSAGSEVQAAPKQPDMVKDDIDTPIDPYANSLPDQVDVPSVTAESVN